MRIERDLSQVTIARTLAISETTVHLWETNQRQPKPYLIPRIIEFLGYAPWTAPQTFGEWLMMARRANGFSRKRLARRLQVDESTVFRWEAGRARPVAELRKRLKLRLAGRHLC